MLCRSGCPADCNYIDPASLVYMKVDDAVPNFKGYTAFRKFGHDAVRPGYWLMQTELNRELANWDHVVKSNDIYSFMINLRPDDFMPDVKQALVEADYS